MSRSHSGQHDPFGHQQPLTRDFFDVPLLGVVTVTGGEEDKKYQIGDIVRNFQSSGEEFVTLVITDNAMRRAGIIKGDYLTVRLRSVVENGDIAVIRLGERFYVRQFFRQSSSLIRLETCDESPSVLVIETRTPDFEVIGKVYSLSRQF
jgi:SOS-response transcriptional repressor LexA